MINAQAPILIGLGLFIAVGCSTPAIEKGRVQSTDPLVGMLHQGIIEMNGTIEQLSRHISDLQQTPLVSGPQLQELQALDLAGWQLHLQHSILQRDHLVFSLNQIQQVLADPRQKATLGPQWSAHQQQFINTLEELAAHRDKLERKRLELESQLLGQYFK